MSDDKLPSVFFNEYFKRKPMRLWEREDDCLFMMSKTDECNVEYIALEEVQKELTKLKEQLEKAHEEINDLEETLESCAISFDWIASNSNGEVKEYAINNSKLIRLDTDDLIKQLEQR